MLERKSSGAVLSIETFSLHNGPGIRTTLFLKGCALGCRWCANPESLNPSPEVTYDRELCLPECGECLRRYPGGIVSRDADGRVSFAGPIPVPADDSFCPTGALSIVGEIMRSAELIPRLVKDRPFFDESGGGVTISGGEPLFQPGFSLDLLLRLKSERIHTALDTAGFADWEILEQVSAAADLILYDLKAVDSELHREWTGVDNRLILDNLTRLLALRGEAVRVRFPLIPGYTDGQTAAAAEFLASRKVRGIDLLPFHSLASRKYRLLGRSYPLEGQAGAGSDQVARAVGVFGENGIAARVSG